jgi:uncharacterized protein (DUF169 family)
MAEKNEWNGHGEEIEDLLRLRTSPIAIRMLESETDIPPGALRPKRDRAVHLAQCQAFSLSRRQGRTVAMLTEDQWCWGPMMAYGLADPGIAEAYPELRDEVRKMPRLEPGRYVGILSAPLKTAGFRPEAVLVYCNNAQLLHMLHALSFAGEGRVNTPLYPIASCALSVIPALEGEYAVTLPDPGELGRALAGEDEIIFSLPPGKVALLVTQLRAFEERQWGYRHHAFLEMRPDFPRPEFYKKFMLECGGDAGDIPVWPEEP